ncbi:hypothetical protein Ddye_019617 [Dipteronia dyeriana]|uniref:COBRA C-terminal domain-containing protein n=1 Tax=Dipteronia dyeriana TaxID=168575 RepID=A0AAD9TYF3_9ROSI|nr:hypothetical protein Ddye_019617 [Dipteronia dyeriana]
MSTAIATWQMVCNISRSKNGKSRCCVSFSAYYIESVILARLVLVATMLTTNVTRMEKQCCFLQSASDSLQEQNYKRKSVGKPEALPCLPGLNFLMGETNGSDPRVPGKQQSVISFKKLKTPGIKIAAGDGFPSKVLFNGQECSLPTEIPITYGCRCHVNMVQVVLVTVVLFV